MDALKEFGDFLLSKSLEKGTDVVMLWRGSDNLDVVLRQAGSDLSKVRRLLRKAEAWFQVPAQQ